MCRSCGRSSHDKDKVRRPERNHRQFANDFCRNFDVFRQGNCMTADDAQKNTSNPHQISPQPPQNECGDDTEGLIRALGLFPARTSRMLQTQVRSINGVDRPKLNANLARRGCHHGKEKARPIGPGSDYSEQRYSTCKAYFAGAAFAT
jgi:hypothetical protein